MEALIEQHAAAFAPPGRAPAAAGVVRLSAIPVRDDPAHADDFAEIAVLDQFSDFQITRLGAELKHRGENLLRMSLRDSDEPFGIGFVRGDRLLDH